MSFLQSIGSVFIGAWLGCGRAVLLLGEIIITFGKIIRRFSVLIHQLYLIGVMSLPIIAIAGLFIGMVLAFQGYTTLRQFGAETALGSLVSLSLLRELAPVVTALLFTGRAGSSVTAEIGLMKATDQLCSLQMMAINPTEYVYLPRFMATLISLPILSILFCVIAILGGYLIAVVQLGVDSAVYWNSMQTNVDFISDVLQGVFLKSLCFALIAALVSVYQGANCRPTAEGIGRATTQTVVVTSLWVLAFDFLLTALFFGTH